ncbi:MAG: SRPBCC family protein [Candidatus Nanopelagicales bacterium]
MDPVTVSRHVEAPPEVVWELTTDIAGSPRTLTGVVRVEMLTEPPFRVGTRWRETRVMMRREATEEMWVTEIDPGTSYTVEAESNGMHYRTVVTVAASPGGGTDLAMTFSGTPTHVVSRVLGAIMNPFVRRSIEGMVGKDLDDLAAAAQSRTTGPD